MRTVSQNQGSPKNPTPSRGRSRIALLAWTISILVHVAIFAAFGTVRLSRADTDTQDRPVPVAQTMPMPRPFEASAVFPKPKVAATQQKAARKNPPPLTNTDRFFEPDTSIPTFDLKHAQSPTEMIAEHSPAAASTEFFGSVTTARRICYVVDCSGSMMGMFARVQRELNQSIEQLQPDQYFGIVFFGGPTLRQFNDGELARAAANAKLSARTFIDSVRPAGRTNSLAALEHAVQMQDSSGKSASTIYLLTDGFELTDSAGTSIADNVKGMVAHSSHSVKINTIGLWPHSSDRAVLEAIAEQTGGEFVSIDTRTPTGDTFNILGLLDQDDR